MIRILNNKATLSVRVLIPGLLLTTLHPTSIAVAAEYLSVDAAQKAVFPQADAFEEVLINPGAERREHLAQLAGPQPAHGLTRFWRATHEGTLVGYFCVDEVIGRQSLITYALGIDAQGGVRNLQIMAYRESHGAEIRNAAWRAQFTRRADLDHLRFRADIKNISDATLSSEHVTQGVRWVVALWQTMLRQSDGQT